MIYLNKSILKPLLIICSFLFVPPIIMLIISCILFNEVQLYVILCCFVLLYIFSFWIVIRESKNKKYYLKICNDSLEILYPNLTSNGEVLSVKITDIEKIDYYKITSPISWLAMFQWTCPKAMFITYSKNNIKENKAIGHAELKEIVKICEEKGIQLIIH